MKPQAKQQKCSWQQESPVVSTEISLIYRHGQLLVTSQSFRSYRSQIYQDTFEDLSFEGYRHSLPGPLLDSYRLAKIILPAAVKITQLIQTEVVHFSGNWSFAIKLTGSKSRQINSVENHFSTKLSIFCTNQQHYNQPQHIMTSVIFVQIKLTIKLISKDNHVHLPAWLQTHFPAAPLALIALFAVWETRLATTTKNLAFSQTGSLMQLIPNPQA